MLSTYPPAEWRLVPRVYSALRVPVKPVLVVLGDVLVEILGDTELPVQLKCISAGDGVSARRPYLIKGDTIVDQIEETIIPDGLLCGCHELLDDCRV